MFNYEVKSILFSFTLCYYLFSYFVDLIMCYDRKTIEIFRNNIIP